MKDTVVTNRVRFLMYILFSAGMKDTVVTDPIKFQQQGGTELAPMSTTENKVHTPCGLMPTRKVTWFDQFAVVWGNLTSALFSQFFFSVHARALPSAHSSTVTPISQPQTLNPEP